MKEKIFKHKTAISKNVYFDVLDDIVSKYNNTVHRAIKMKPIDNKSDSYAEYNEDVNEKEPKLKFWSRKNIKIKKLVVLCFLWVKVAFYVF